MPDREDVIWHLKHAREIFINAGYEWYANWIYYAIDLLKAQEPRLVTKEDFKYADEYGYLPAWGEMPDDLFCECILIGALEEEGIRYWTSRPTEEQRRETKWDA